MPNNTPEPTSETYGSFLYAYNYFNAELFDNSLPKVLFTYQRKSRVMGYASSKRWIDVDGNHIDELAMNPEYFARYAMIEICDTLVHEMCHIWQFHHGHTSRNGYHNASWGNKMEEVGLMPSSTKAPGGKKTGQQVSHYIIKDGPFINGCVKLKQNQFAIPFKDRFPVLRSHSKVYAYDENDTPYLIDENYHTDKPSILPPSPPTIGASDEPLRSDIDGEVFTEIPISIDYEGYSKVVEEALSSKPLSTTKSSKTKYTCSGCKTNVWGKPSIKVSCVPCGLPFVLQL